MCNLSVENHCLVITNKRYEKELGRFRPREIKYDSIILARPFGSISYQAMNWLIAHSISLSVLDWKGNIIANVVPNDPIASNELKIVQYRAYSNKETRFFTAKTIVE